MSVVQFVRLDGTFWNRLTRVRLIKPSPRWSTAFANSAWTEGTLGDEIYRECFVCRAGQPRPCWITAKTILLSVYLMYHDIANLLPFFLPPWYRKNLIQFNPNYIACMYEYKQFSMIFNYELDFPPKIWVHCRLRKKRGSRPRVHYVVFPS